MELSLWPCPLYLRKEESLVRKVQEYERALESMWTFWGKREISCYCRDSKPGSST